MAALRPSPTLEPAVKLTTLVSLCLVAFVGSLSPAAQAQTFSVIHTFTGSGGGGAIPKSGVTIRAGVLYGTTYLNDLGSDSGEGAVYQMTQTGSDWTYTPIFLFPADGSGGAHPAAGVVVGPDSHLYGTTNSGGSDNNGVVFDLTPPLSVCKTVRCFWKQNVIHNFAGVPDGGLPEYGNLTWDAQGNIYGTTSAGGAYDLGAVFEITKSGNTWKETPIYSFSGGNSDGSSPQNGVIVDANGRLFGTTLTGGLYNPYVGTVFAVTYIPGVGWQEKILFAFTGGDEGRYPAAGLIFDKNGNLYGTTTDGGSGGGGTIFELSPFGDTWVFNLLYSFPGQSGNNCGPWGTLTMDAAGNLYGATYCDGAYQQGNIFELANTANGWTYTSLHDFSGGSDGAYPSSSVNRDTDGTLYGTATVGGSSNKGVVWMIQP